MKKIITNAFCALYCFQPQHIQWKRLGVNKAHPVELKEKAEDILKFVRRKVQ